MSHVATVTIDNTQVGADLTDFPVYIDLSDLPSSFWDVVANGGGDIRVYKDDDTTELAREVVSCDTATDTGELHVKFTGTLSSSSDTDIHIYADGTSSEPAVSATYGRNAVWSDYKCVLHMDEASGNAVDSTGNGDWTDNNTVAAVTGQIEGGRDFTKVNNEMFITTRNILDGMSSLTVQFWFNKDSSNTDPQFIWSFERQGNANDPYANWSNLDQPAGNNDLSFGLENSSGARTILRSNKTDFANDTWYFTHQTWNGSTMRQYFDGSVDANTGSRTGSFTDDSVQKFWGGNDAATNRDFDGTLDECRVRLSDVGADWIDAEYTNQNTPSTFYSTAAAGGGGGGPTPTKNAMFFGAGM